MSALENTTHWTMRQIYWRTQNTKSALVVCSNFITMKDFWGQIMVGGWAGNDFGQQFNSDHKATSPATVAKRREAWFESGIGQRINHNSNKPSICDGHHSVYGDGERGRAAPASDDDDAATATVVLLKMMMFLMILMMLMLMMLLLMMMLMKVDASC